MIDDGIKLQVRERLCRYCDNTGSDNRAARSLGVSNAYISHIKNNNWSPVSDDMWRKLSKLLGLKLDEVWAHADTEPGRVITRFFNDSRLYAQVYGMVCHAGSGKTYTLNNFIASHKNVLCVKCTALMTVRSFYTAILKSMGKTPDSYNLNDIFSQVVRSIIKLENPVLVIDEFETTNDKVFVQFKDLYNELEDRCGIVLLGTPNLKKRVDDGNRRNKMCFNEIFDRVGSRFIEVPAPGLKDVAGIIRANLPAIASAKEGGITGETDVNAIANDCITEKGEYSLRRIKRLVHATRLRREVGSVQCAVGSRQCAVGS
jgi:DNA transposition AAA+ family ATPase